MSIKSFLLPFFILVGSLHSMAQYHLKVNPFIGTGGHGHTFPGAASPFGMVQLSPDTRLDGWDGCSGYHHSDSLIYGFSHTHLSGTGCSDYGDILLMPVMKEPRDKEVLFSNRFYASRFSHSGEKAHAGYYSVFLEDDQIQADMTTSERVGFHQYTFGFGGNVRMVLDLLHRDELLDGQIKMVDNHTIEGFRKSKAWATDQLVFFRIEFSKNSVESISFSGKKGVDKTGLALVFRVAKGEKLGVKVSLSQVSTMGAALNMKTEIPHWDFAKVKSENEMRWEKELSKIIISDPDPNKETIFYTALYHSFLQPNIASDVDGQYRGMDKKVHPSPGHPVYTVFSLWDTFRSAHPLYNLVQRERNLDFVRTFLLQYQQGGRLPVWELWANETDCMIGYHSVSVIADAWAKGLRDFDKNLAVRAMLASANRDLQELNAYRSMGYIPTESGSESVSKTLEYAYDDWCIAQFLEGSQKLDFERRSQSWKHLFDRKTKMMRPRQNGGWIHPFDPKEVNHNFTEANAWQYAFFVPQDVGGLMDFHGGKAAFVQKLDEIFTSSSQLSGNQQPDITGLIGQYAHGNEPSHHIPWLYTLAGAPQKTQNRVREILNTLYKNEADGLSGNEDCGQMSAWLVMSALGLYALCPGSDQYVMGTPWFDQISLQYGEGKWIKLEAKNSAQAPYIQSVQKDGKSWKNLVISHADWVNAGEWKFQCTPDSEKAMPWAGLAPKTWGSITPAPVIFTENPVFRGQTKVKMENHFDKPMHYFMDQDTRPVLYADSLILTKSTQIRVRNGVGNEDSLFVSTGNFHKMPNDWAVTLVNQPNKMYRASPDVLIDGLRGDENWKKGGWQGYQYQDLEAIVDLKKTKSIKRVFAGFLQENKYWILMPKEMEVLISNDGKQFQSIGKVGHDISAQKEGAILHDFNLILTKPVKAQYVKVNATRFGPLPDWHPGKGEPSFIFVDEIGIE